MISKYIKKLSATGLSLLLVGSVFVPVLAQSEDPMSGPDTNQAEQNLDPIEGDHYIVGIGGDLNQRIKGDLFVSSASLRVMEKIDENIFFASNPLTPSNLELNDNVAKSVYFVGGNFKLSARVSENVFIVGNDVEINGKVSDDAYIVADRVLINSDIGDDLRISAKEVYLGEGASVKDVVSINAEIIKIHPVIKFGDDQVVAINNNGIDGIEQFRAKDAATEIPVSLDVAYSSVNPLNTIKSTFSVYGLIVLIASTIGSAVVVYMLMKYFPVKSSRVISNYELDSQNIVQNFKVGFVTFVLAGLGLVVLSISIVGWPLLIVLGLLGLLANQLSKFYFLYKVGDVVLQKIQPGIENSFVKGLVGSLVTVVLTMLVALIPYVGGAIVTLVSLVIGIWSIGGVVRVKLEAYKKK